MSGCIAIELKSSKYDGDEQSSCEFPTLDEFDELELELGRQGVRPISHFMFHDIELLEEMLEYAPEDAIGNLQCQLDAARQQPKWHDAKEGVATLSVLIELVRGQQGYQGVLPDLERFQRVLYEAEKTGDRFRFVVV